MSEKMTRIVLHGKGSLGIMLWGEWGFEAMVLAVRRHYQQQLEDAQAILSAADSDFDVDVIRGPLVQRHVRKVLPGNGQYD